MFDYMQRVKVDSNPYSPGDPDLTPSYMVIELDKSANVTERPVELTDHSSRKYFNRMKHSWTAQYAAKNGSVAVFNYDFFHPDLLINGRRIDLGGITLKPLNCDERENRIKRLVSGIRSEYLEEAKECLEVYQRLEEYRSIEFRREMGLLDIEAYVEWAELSEEIPEPSIREEVKTV